MEYEEVYKGREGSDAGNKKCQFVMGDILVAMSLITEERKIADLGWEEDHPPLSKRRLRFNICPLKCLFRDMMSVHF